MDTDRNAWPGIGVHLCPSVVEKRSFPDCRSVDRQFEILGAAAEREFARRVAVVERLKASQRAALAQFDALFASLQHRAFRGEL